MTDTRTFENHDEPHRYWEGRARRFAAQGEGLAAVCSFGMPEFYNRAIQLTQRLALAPWLDARRGPVLDAGCGVGRWSRWLAHRGASVTGVDLSPTMAAEARRRAADEGIGDRCRFMVGDLRDFDAGGARHGLVVGVTVLQHILDDAGLQAAIDNLARHLAPGGRMVLLEAAPTRRVRRCDSPIFKARGAEAYLDAFARARLRVERVTGVDPAPFKTWYLPHYRRLPAPLARAGLAAATAAGLPFDALLGRVLAPMSWHKVFVLGHARD